jgi:hypothetical protein
MDLRATGCASIEVGDPLHAAAFWKRGAAILELCQ